MARTAHIGMSGQVKILKANLDERYKEFFCVVQELLQNADDSKASKIVIGQLDKLSQHHQLCNTPGIFILNNGPVSDNDLDHIFSIAESNKEEDSDKIGKFGLGMKSVFHLCETFFVFGHQSTDSVAEHNFLEFFDPWGNDIQTMPGLHPAWRTEVDSKKDILLQDIKDSLKNYHDLGDDWFGLWLPLRDRKQCVNGSGALLR